MKNICITIPTIRWSEPTISVTEQIESQNEQNRNKPSSKEKCQQWSIRKNGTVSVQVSLSSPASFLQLYKLSPGLSKNERYWYHPINLSTIPWPEVSDCTFTNKLNRDRSRSWDCITISSSCLHSPSHNFGSCSRPEDHSGRGCTYSQYGQKFHGEESLAPPHWFLWGLRYGLQFALFTKTNSLFFNPLLDFFILWMCVYETCASPYVRQHSCQQEKLHCFWISYDLLHTNSVVTRMKGESEQFWRTSLFLGCPYALFLPCSSPWDLMRSSKHVCCCSYPSHICTQYWNKFALAIIPVSEHTLSGKETIL